MGFRIIFFILLLKFSCVFSQADSIIISSNEGLRTDSLLKQNYSSDNAIYPKKIQQNYQSKYQGKDFDYTTIKPKESLWQKLERRLKKILESLLGTAPIKAQKITEVITWALAIIIVATVLYFLIKILLSQNGNFIFGKKNKKINLNEADLHENIHEIHFPERIYHFEQQKDYRSAIRYHFLFALKKLADGNRIIWNPEKTNKDYINELKNTAHSQSFGQLSYIFDNVWYGEFELQETQYQDLKQQFLNFSV